VPRPEGAATVLDVMVNGTELSERFAASAPLTIATVMPATAPTAGAASSADLRQRVTPLGSLFKVPSWLGRCPARGSVRGTEWKQPFLRDVQRRHWLDFPRLLVEEVNVGAISRQ
jgi:hypothetical protein